MELNLKYSALQSEVFFEHPEAKYKIVPKGRRAGLTQGAAQAYIEYMLDGVTPLLWGDTIAGNIDRYVDRYFKPVLSQLPAEMWRWKVQERVLTIGGAICDFRSADRPENWEGFGYKRIFLNEAGIILKNRYLYQNAVLPMLIDFPESQLIAAGVPKEGTQGVFYELWNQVEAKPGRYWGKRYTSFDNPFLSREDLVELLADIPKSVYGQEILGQFVDVEGARIKREWLRYGQFPGGLVTMGVDLAISLKDSAAWTTVVIVGRDSDGRVYVLDAQRLRAPFHQQLEFFKQMAAKWQPKRIAIEQVQYQAAAVQELLRTTALPVAGVHPDKDKLTRFQPLEVRYEQGMVYHTPGLSPAFEDELLSFPVGEYNDQVDAFVYAYLALQNAAFAPASVGDDSPEIVEHRRQRAIEERLGTRETPTGPEPGEFTWRDYTRRNRQIVR